MTRRLYAVVAVVLAAVAGIFGAPVLVGVGATAGASPLPLSRCTPTSGVLLAVDFGHWGGPIVRACGSTPTTGYTLVNEGGFSTAGTAHDGPGFVCRIASASFGGGASYPSTTEQSCVRTPHTSAYWSYWHAGPTQGSWSFSTLGAVSYSPQPGSVDAWAFGAGKPPAVGPNALRVTGVATSPPRSAAPASTASTASRPSTTPPRSGDRASPPAHPSAGPSTPDRSTTVRSTGGRSAPPVTRRPLSAKPGSTAAGSGPTAPPTAGSAAGTRTTNRSVASAPTTVLRRPSPTGAGEATARGIPASRNSTSGAGAARIGLPSTPVVVDARAVAAGSQHSRTSATPALVAVALVGALLVAGAALARWRRRQAG